MIQLGSVILILLFAPLVAINHHQGDLSRHNAQEPRLTIDATSAGIVNDGITDNSEAIQAAIGSNKILHFPKGKYVINKFVQVAEIRNLRISGEAETEFITTTNKIFSISGSIDNLEITGIKFISTKRDPTNDPEGLIFIGAYGADDHMSDININHCTFTNPDTHANAIKLVSEGTRSFVTKIKITHNRFESIGRFAIEFQNHERTTQLARYQDYNISNNYFYDVGTIQSWPAPSCVSVSGYSRNGKINHNEFREMRMKSASHIYYGIENAGAVGLETIGNKMYASTYGFTGILASGPTAAESARTGQPGIRDWTIKDNIIELTGPVIDKIRGIELSDVESYYIANNTITVKGYAMRFINCKSGKIVYNNCTVSAGNVLYFESGSSNNEITGNTLNASAGPDEGVVIFSGSTTRDNSVQSNILIKTAGLPGSCVDRNGARNNF